MNLNIEKKSKLGRIDYLILTTLWEEKAFSPTVTCTIQEINEVVSKVKRSCIWKHIHTLIQEGFLIESGLFKRQKEYYLSEKGKETIERWSK